MKQAFILSIFLFFGSNICSAQCLGFQPTGAGDANLRLTTGNQDMDNAIQREVNILNPAFGVNVQTWVFDDSRSPNADASSRITNPQRPDGTIRLGLMLMQHQFEYNDWGASVPLIMAHEFAHIKAFKNRWQFRGNDPTVKKDELFADFCAGCYMYDRQFILGIDMDATRRAFYALGDNQFNNINHHGTPEERERALMAGYNFTQNFRRNNRQGTILSDEILRNGFLSFISSVH